MKKFSHCSPTLFLFGWPMKYFFQIEKKIGGRLKKKSVGSYSETETVYFLLLKLLGATLGRLFFTFKCLNLRKIAFYSMFIKKTPCSSKIIALVISLIDHESLAIIVPVSATKLLFSKLKKNYMDKKDNLTNAFLCFSKITYLSYSWIH